MTKNFKQWCLLLIATIMLSISASAESVEINGIYYNLMDNNIAEVAYKAYLYEGDIVIPEEILYNDIIYRVEIIGEWAFAGSEITSVIIPNSVNKIGMNAFNGCLNLTSITLPDSITSIASYMFSGCQNITSIIIPTSVRVIGQAAFSYCRSIESIIIPDSVRFIGEYAFSGCEALETITIPNGVSSMGSAAFSGCISLKVISIPNSIINFGTSIFFGCNKLESVIFPDNITRIEGCMFQDCTSLKSITIPSSVGVIDLYSFYGCKNLNTITFKGYSIIKENAFANCSSLKDVFCYSDNPPNVSSDVFLDSYIDLATLHVKKSAINTYAQKDPWKYFLNIVKIDMPKHKLTYMVDGEVYKIEEIEEGETVIPESFPIKEGYSFSGWSEIPETMPTHDVTVTGSFNINVPVGDVSLDKSEAILEKGKTMTLKATVYPETLEDKSVTWKSSNTAVATVSSTGKVKGVKAGIVTITCTSVATGATATCDLTVGYVKLDQTEAILEKGESVVLTPTVYPSKLSDRSVTWKSSNTKIATVTSSGEVRGIMAGTATITCTSNATGLSVTCAVTVKGISLSKSEAILEKGKTMTLKPTFYPEIADKSVTWKSSNTAVATVSSTGKVKGVKAGIVTITCTSVATDATATCDLTVGYVKLDKAEATLEKGESVVLTPTVYPSKLSDRSVTWKSSNETIATVTSGGEVKGVLAGTATITCTSNATGLSVTCVVTVNGISLSKSEAILEKTKTMTLSPTFYPESLSDKSVTWKSSDTKVATVTSDGTIKGVKAGMVTITCTSVATGATATCKLTVGYVKLDKTEVAVKKNKTVTLTPTVYPSKLEDRSVTWKSSDETVATVTSSGKVKGVKYGTATITCTSNATGLSTTCTVTVGTVYLNIAEVTIHKGRALTLTPTVYPNTLTDKSVTWKSSDKTVATVTSAGKVKGVNSGTATITCTSVATGLSSTCKVTVIEFAGARFVYEDDDEVTGIENIDENPVAEEPFDVYNLRGRKVLHRVTSLDGLPAGVYIVNGKKVLKK